MQAKKGRDYPSKDSFMRASQETTQLSWANRTAVLVQTGLHRKCRVHIFYILTLDWERFWFSGDISVRLLGDIKIV